MSICRVTARSVLPKRSLERRPYDAAAAKLASSRTIAFFDHTLKT
jgi:dienelactone hydrolase